MTRFKISDFPWEIKKPKGIIVKYSVSNNDVDIMLCRRYIKFVVDKKYEKIKNKVKKKFLFIPYIYIVEEEIEVRNQTKYGKLGFKTTKYKNSYTYSKVVYAITYGNLLLEIDEDMYKELEQFTLIALTNRSVDNIQEL